MYSWGKKIRRNCFAGHAAITVHRRRRALTYIVRGRYAGVSDYRNYRTREHAYLEGTWRLHGRRHRPISVTRLGKKTSDEKTSRACTFLLFDMTDRAYRDEAKYTG